MSLVQPYAKLRKDMSQRDRSLREKIVSLKEAISFVRDGDAVGIGGSTMSRTPMGLIWALIRAGRKNLSCSRCIVSSDGDLLYGSGATQHIVTSWFSQGILWGVSKVMRHYVETGKARYDEWSHLAMGMRFRAGAMGVPFMPIRSMLGLPQTGLDVLPRDALDDRLEALLGEEATGRLEDARLGAAAAFLP